jgi:tetratricopeptide (TPR) repeat protein
MAKVKYLFAALVAASSVPAIGSVIVIGNSNARMCYEAADSPANPSLRNVQDCDTALSEEAMSQHDRVATYVNRGILRLRRGQPEAAIADFDEAIELNPRQPEAFLNKGAALIRLENPSAALPLFEAALEYNTRRPEIAHFGRAIANEELGNIRAAYQDYRRASELDPNWQDPRTELARFRVVDE